MAVKRAPIIKPTSVHAPVVGGFSGTSGKIPTRPIPPSGTSARKAYDKTMREGTGVPQTTLERLTGTYNYPAKPSVSNSKRKVSSGGYGGSGGFSGSSGSGGFSDSSGSAVSAQETFDYYEAPIAQQYGFSKTTAYQEALANTAYRREMEDMRKAGLNPSVIYGSHNSSGADSDVIPREDYSSVSGGYSGSRGGSSGGYSRHSRGGNSGKYVFSGGAYYGIMAGVGAITAMATHNVGAGMAAAGLAGTAMKALNGFFKK